jgi:hypothetical protein
LVALELELVVALGVLLAGQLVEVALIVLEVAE